MEKKRILIAAMVIAAGLTLYHVKKMVLAGESVVSEIKARAQSIAQSPFQSRLQLAEEFKKRTEGSWVQECRYSEKFKTSYQQSIVFSNLQGSHQFTTTAKWYEDKNCEKLYLIEEQTRQIITTSSTADGWKVFGQLSEQTMTMKNKNTTKFHNEQKTCGLERWVTNQTISTLNTDCRRDDLVVDLIQISEGQIFRALDEVNANEVVGRTVGNLPYLKR